MRARVLGVVAVGVVAACAGSPDVETRTVTFHAPLACPVGASPFGLVFATGDFQPNQQTDVLTELFLANVGETLAAVPTQTRSLTATVTADAAGATLWQGLAGVPESGDVDVLLWPSTAPCPLSQPDPPLRNRTGAGVAAIDDRRVLVVGGAADSVIPASFDADMTTGVQNALVTDLLVPRKNATVTRFAGGAVVAGGARPDSGELLDSAELFNGTDFDGQPIILLEGRAAHAAIALETGETLLIGGSGVAGPLKSLEFVDPVKRRSRTIPNVSLEVARTSPVALRLASGEILVAGGFDAADKPVKTVEWLAPNGTAHANGKHSRELVASEQRGFVALPGGGALAVMATTDPSVTTNVWVISADGDFEPATRIPPPLTVARLFSGSAGQPILWTGDRWLRWQSWRGEFQVSPEIASRGPDRAEMVSPDNGLAMWVGNDVGHTTLFGLRFDARGAYVTDSLRGPLLSEGTAFMAPDRLVGLGPIPPITFDSTRGLVLTAGTSAFLTDATFAAFTLDLMLTGPAPFVVLRSESGDEIEVGGGTCPLVIPDGAGSIHVERALGAVTVRFDAGDPVACRTPLLPGARVAIGLRGADGVTSSAKNLIVKRGTP